MRDMDRIWAGAKLRQVRMLAGLSLYEVAAAVGVAQPTVSNWEMGRSVPTVEHLARLAECYGISEQALISAIRMRTDHELAGWYRTRTSDNTARRGSDNPSGAGANTDSHRGGSDITERNRMVTAGAA